MNWVKCEVLHNNHYLVCPVTCSGRWVEKYFRASLQIFNCFGFTWQYEFENISHGNEGKEQIEFALRNSQGLHCAPMLLQPLRFGHFGPHQFNVHSTTSLNTFSIRPYGFKVWIQLSAAKTLSGKIILWTFSRSLRTSVFQAVRDGLQVRAVFRQHELGPQFQTAQNKTGWSATVKLIGIKRHRDSLDNIRGQLFVDFLAVQSQIIVSLELVQGNIPGMIQS